MLKIGNELITLIRKISTRRFITGSCSETSLPIFDNRKIAKFTKQNGNTDLLTINSNGQIVIGAGISKVKVSFNARYDWDNPLDKVYYTMLNKNGDDWSTMGAIRQNDTIQYIHNYSNKVYDVSEADVIQLFIACSDNISNAKSDYYITVEIIE